MSWFKATPGAILGSVFHIPTERRDDLVPMISTEVCAHHEKNTSQLFRVYSRTMATRTYTYIGVLLGQLDGPGR